MPKKPEQEKGSWYKSINSYLYVLASFLFIIFLTSIPEILNYNSSLNLEGTANNYEFIITADSLITTATITLIVFTNFAPSSSSGSSSVIRRVYWRSRYLTTNAKMHHKIIWVLSASFLIPSYIIIITLLTTVAEICLTIACVSLYWEVSMLIITSVMMMAALSRFIIFHLYSNKNVAIWLVEKVSNNCEFLKSKSLYLDFLSYFRTTGNFELVYVILKKYEKERISVSNITRTSKPKIWARDIPTSMEGIMHPTATSDELNQELLILNIFVFNLISNPLIFQWDKENKIYGEKWLLLQEYLLTFYDPSALVRIRRLIWIEGDPKEKRPGKISDPKDVKKIIKKELKH